MRLLILAAGYAVRLQPLTLNMPKSLLEIGKRTILDRILDKAAKVAGISSVSVVTNARFFENFIAWQKKSKFGKTAKILNDGSTSNETRLGAIKDLEFAIKADNIDDDLLVIAGDNLFELDLGTFLAFARKRRDGVTAAVYDIGDLEAAKKFGVVTTDKDGLIVDFKEKPEKPESTLVSTGIYYFPKDKIRLIDEYANTGNKLDAPGHYISWLARDGKAYGFRFKEDWFDIGDIESYKKVDKLYSERKK